MDRLCARARIDGLDFRKPPTGSRKTLAMLKLALEHARRHGLKRIVLAVPFLTIIEQTARVYRDVFAGFPEHFVLEHHSLAGLGAETAPGDARPPRSVRLEKRGITEYPRTPVNSTDFSDGLSALSKLSSELVPGTEGYILDGLQEMSNCDCCPGRAGR
ncbi:hypothetical protein [Thiocapsa bogorovii]|uniref:hypothetical protein n=1 Tax=Thiocapsa bogorovii TaxID=521689 RepID=UPI001E4F0637|nr:hypothetical protein [Thiocapsa bogorovii]UHD18013.1 hypothetical protein LT988_08240 [Thiocapsa bogorovii]